MYDHGRAEEQKNPENKGEKQMAALRSTDKRPKPLNTVGKRLTAVRDALDTGWAVMANHINRISPKGASVTRQTLYQTSRDKSYSKVLYWVASAYQVDVYWLYEGLDKALEDSVFDDLGVAWRPESPQAQGVIAMRALEQTHAVTIKGFKALPVIAYPSGHLLKAAPVSPDTILAAAPSGFIENSEETLLYAVSRGSKASDKTTIKEGEMMLLSTFIQPGKKTLALIETNSTIPGSRAKLKRKDQAYKRWLLAEIKWTTQPDDTVIFGTASGRIIFRGRKDMRDKGCVIQGAVVQRLSPLERPEPEAG